MIKDVVDAERCGHVFPGDVLVAVNDVAVGHWSHDDVVNLLRGCRSRRVARLTLMTSRHAADPVRRAAADPYRPESAMASPRVIDLPSPSVDYLSLIHI